MEQNDSFGIWIRRRRRALDMTQEQLAAQAGCALVTIKKIERDSLRPSVLLARRLAQALQLSDLVTGDFVRVARQEHLVNWLPAPQQVAVPQRTHGIIPQPTNPLIGRSTDVQTLMRLIDYQHVRLVTLVGAPGIGKTRLALELLHLLAERVTYAAFIDLTEIDEAMLIPNAIRNGLQLLSHQHKSDAEVVCAAIAEHPAVLILDNYEHVLAGASLAAQLIRTCPRLLIIATSREPLCLQAEHVFALSALTLPAHNDLEQLTVEQAQRSSAMLLLLSRIRATQRQFKMTGANVQALAQLCIACDGLPLALELLAPQIAYREPAHILEELNGCTPPDHFAMLISDARDILPRHQSLNDAIHWSYQRLEPPEQTLLCDLAVFAGGWTLEAAYAIMHQFTSAETHRMLMRLAQCSLIQYAVPDRPRYQMLVTIRTFGQQQLAATNRLAQVRHQHASYFLQLAQQSTAYVGQQQSHWWQILNADRENIRMAMNWFLEQQDAMSLFQAIIALAYYWRFTGQLREALEWIEHALQLAIQGSHTQTLLFAQVLLCAGDIHYHRAEGMHAKQYFERCAAILKEIHDPVLQAQLYYRQGRQIEGAQGVQLLLESLRYAQEVHDKQLQAMIFHELGGRMRWQGRYAESIAYHNESIALYRMLGEQAETADALALLASTLVQLGSYDKALQYEQESIQILRQSPHYRMHLAWSLQTLGMIYSSIGAFDEARAAYLESYQLFQRMGDGSGLAWNPYDRARIELRAGKPDIAAPLLYESLHLFETIGDLRARAWCHCLLSDVACAQQAYLEGARQMFQALTLFWESDGANDIVALLPACAELALYENRAAQAVQFLGAEAGLRQRQNMPLAPADQPRLDRLLIQVRTVCDPQSFETEWNLASLWSIAYVTTKAMEVMTGALLYNGMADRAGR